VLIGGLLAVGLGGSGFHGRADDAAVPVDVDDAKPKPSKPRARKQMLGKPRAKEASDFPAIGCGNGSLIAGDDSSPTNGGATRRRCSTRFLPRTATASFVRTATSEHGRASSLKPIG
jgi:hypothetical protein